MSLEDIQIRLTELEATLPPFDLTVLRAVVAKAEGVELREARFVVGVADLMGSRAQHKVCQLLWRALDGDHRAECELWLDGPALMSKAGFDLLRAAWAYLPDAR